MRTNLNKLENLADAKIIRRNSTAYKMIKESFESEKEIRPCYLSGSGRYTKNQDHTAEIINYLKRMNIPYTFGNDAPKFGKTGNYIRLV